MLPAQLHEIPDKVRCNVAGRFVLGTGDEVEADKGAWDVAQRGAGGMARYSTERWFSALPSHSQDFLAGSLGKQVLSLSKDCSIFGKSLDDFSQISCNAM